MKETTMKTEWKCLECKAEFYTVMEATEHFDKYHRNSNLPISRVILPVRLIL